MNGNKYIYMYTSFAEGKRGRDAIYDNINFKLQRIYIYIFVYFMTRWQKTMM